MIFLRALSSLVLAVVWWLLSVAGQAAGDLVLSNAAVSQLENSNASYMGFLFTSATIKSMVGFPLTLVIGTMLVGIWWRPLKGLVKWVAAGAAVAVICCAIAQPAHAYYEDRDYPEFLQILPNQTVFLVPVKGANKDSQAQFMSQQYLESVKVAAKRVQITHEELKMPMLSINKVVPSVQAYVVDRTPYMRSWVSGANRGTSNRDEGMYFESADSINIGTGITISASIEEKNAATFLYYFGTKPLGDASKPEVIYSSVVYGRSLAEVVDQNVHGMVQAVMAKEFGSRPFEKALAEKAQIMDKVEQAVKAKFEPMGITIHYVGFAEGLSFAKDVQASIDNTIIAAMKAREAGALAPAIPVLQAQNDMVVKATLANKWNGQVNLPSFLVASDGVMNWVSGLFKPDTPKAAAKQ